MFVFYLGVAGRQPLQGYAAPPISFIICNQLICLYAMIVHLEMGNKYHIISYQTEIDITRHPVSGLTLNISLHTS
jgi:hypothetical protein